MSARNKSIEGTGTEVGRPQASPGPGTRARSGDSETHFTEAELAQLASGSAHGGPKNRTVEGAGSANATWLHGRVVAGEDGATWRQDSCGAWIHREQFGHESEFGWKAVNVAPGADRTEPEFRPFHWRNDYDAANRKPHCRVTADRTGIPAGEEADPPRNRER